MVDNEILMFVWNMISYVLKGVGGLAWSLGVFSVLLPKLNSSFGILPSPISLRVLWLLAHRGVACSLLIGAWYLPLSFLLILGPFYFSQLEIMLIAIACGAGLYLLQGQKGLGMPLGSGLTMTIEKAPNLGFLLSKYVMSFHVDKKFIKKRRQITDLIVDTINAVKVTGDEYDFVLKSWIFANRDDADEKQVMRVRTCMRRAQRICIAFGTTCLIVALLWIYDFIWNNIQFLNLGYRLFIGGLALAIFMLTLMLYCAKKPIRVICSSSKRSLPTDTTRRLAEELERKTCHYRHEFIAHRPIPMLHLASLSVMTQDVIETCVGAEAGFALLRR